MKSDTIKMIKDLMWGDNSIFVELRNFDGLNMSNYKLLCKCLQLYAYSLKEKKMISKEITHYFLHSVAVMDSLSYSYQGKKNHQEIADAFENIIKLMSECLNVNDLRTNE